MGRVSTTAKPTVTHIRGHEVVPESVLRRRKTLAEVKEKREEILAAQRVKRSTKPGMSSLLDRGNVVCTCLKYLRNLLASVSVAVSFVCVCVRVSVCSFVHACVRVSSPVL